MDTHFVNTLITLYPSFLIATLMLAALQLLILFKYRNSRTAQAYRNLLIVMAGIEAAMLLSMYSPTAAWAAWWHGNVRLGLYTFFAPVGFWFIYALVSQSSGEFDLKMPAWIMPLVAVTSLLCLTNDWHHLIFRSYVMVSQNGYYARSTWTPNWWFWLYTLQSYAFGIAMLWLLWRWMGRAHKLPRLRGAAIMVSVLFVMVALTLDTFGLYLVPGLLWLPAALGITNIGIMATMWYLDLFDVLPIARETIIREMRDLVMVLDSQNNVIDVNLAGEQALGMPRSIMQGRSVFDFIPPDYRAAVKNLLTQANWHGEIQSNLGKGLQYFDVLYNAIYTEKDFVGVKLVVMRDITANHQAQLAQAESEAKHRFLYESMQQGVLYQTAQGEIIAVNHAAEEILGLPQEDLRTRTLADPCWQMIREDGRALIYDQFPTMQALALGCPVTDAVVGLRHQGDHEYRWLQINATPQFLPGEAHPYLVYTLLNDITNQRLREEEDRQLAAQQERQRLARDLHDAVSQTLFSALLTTEMLKRQAKLPAAQQEHLDMLARLVKSALGEMRVLLFELRPEGLANADLNSLLGHLADAMSARGTAEIQFQASGMPYDLPVDTKIAFYRIAQEALNNTVKHANASQIVLKLEWCEDALRLLAADNGSGFHLDCPTGDRFGIRIMRERATEMAAALTIESDSTSGTRITCLWPRRQDEKITVDRLPRN